MKLKSLLSISTILLVLLSCSENKDLVDDIKPILKEDSTVVYVEDENLLFTDKRIDSIFKDSVTLTSIEMLNRNNSIQTKSDNPAIGPPVFSYRYDGVLYNREPQKDSFYILFPKAREDDSILLFSRTYNFLNKKFERNGMENQFSRDSVIWDEWQKTILESDLRHQYVPYGSATMKWGAE